MSIENKINSDFNKETEDKLNRGSDFKNVRRYLIVTIGVALLLLIGLWIWKTVEINKLKRTAEAEKITLKRDATRQLVETNADYLKLLAKPMIWAIRTEMMQGNMNQVNLYLNDMVKERNFKQIAIANEKGIIVSSTDKKDEGQPFSVIGKESYLRNDNTNLENVSDSLLIMTSPIMGFNNRLGTLMVKYSIPKPLFN